MKSNIHPNYHMIKVVMTNGVEFMTRSTYGQDGATLHLDIDPNTHPAWTGGSTQLLDRGSEDHHPGSLDARVERLVSVGAHVAAASYARAADQRTVKR